MYILRFVYSYCSYDDHNSLALGVFLSLVIRVSPILKVTFLVPSPHITNPLFEGFLVFFSLHSLLFSWAFFHPFPPFPSLSSGVIYDFAGPYTIGKQHMAFGPPTRYIQLDPSLCRGTTLSLAHTYKRS